MLVVLRSIPKLTRLSVDSWFPDGAPVSLGSVPILADLSLIHGADIRTRPGGGGGGKLLVNARSVSQLSLRFLNGGKSIFIL